MPYVISINQINIRAYFFIITFLLFLPLSIVRAEGLEAGVLLFDLDGDNCLTGNDLTTISEELFLRSEILALNQSWDQNRDHRIDWKDYVRVILSPGWLMCVEDNGLTSEGESTVYPQGEQPTGGTTPSEESQHSTEADNTQTKDSPNGETDFGSVPASVKLNLGTNLAQPNYVIGPLMFINRMQTARPWSAQSKECASFDCGPEVPLTTEGYPRHSPFRGGYTAKTQVATGDGSGKFNGIFTITFQGSGKVRLWGRSLGLQTEYTFQGPCHNSKDPCVFPFEVKNDGGEIADGIRARLFIELEESRANDPIRDIQILPPGVSPESAKKNPFYEGFLKEMKQFSTIRYMDWLATNRSDVRDWNQRTTKDDPVQTSDKGTALEWIIELSNRSETDPWINIPTLATDQYIRALAKLLADPIHGLAPGRKVYIEYSNEVWNGLFARQNQFAIREARRRFGYKDFETDRFVARRSLEIFKLFHEVFGNKQKSRIVEVLPAQAAAYGAARKMLETFYDERVNPKQAIRVDAIAINPYFGGRTTRRAIESGEIYDMTLTDLFERVKDEIAIEVIPALDAYKQIAAEYNCDIVGYEGGQHFAAHTVYSRSEEAGVMDLLNEANRDPRIKDLYRAIFTAWGERGFGVFNHYLHVLAPSRFGDWGSKHYQTEPLELSPKAQVISEHNVRIPFGAPPSEEAGSVLAARIERNKKASSLGRIIRTVLKDLWGTGRKVRSLRIKIRNQSLKFRTQRNVNDRDIRRILESTQSLKKRKVRRSSILRMQRAVVLYFLGNRDRTAR